MSTNEQPIQTDYLAKALASAKSIPGILTNEVYSEIQSYFQTRINQGLKAFIANKDIYSPNPTAVVTFTEAYPRFATGYIENELNDTKIPYTINYGSLIAGDSLLVQSQWENGDPIWQHETVKL